MARSVVLTGATGLIGRQTVAPLVDQGYRVIALSRAGRAVAGAEGLACDILDPGSRRAALGSVRATHLLHLAWHDGTANRWRAAENIDWAAATLALTREFAAAGGQRAVLVGSCAEYDWTGATILREDSPLDPATLYGAAKARTGQMLLAAAPELGLSLAWARPFFCYGPAEPPGRLLGDLISGLSAGEPVAVTDGRQVRDFLHAADLGADLAALLDSRYDGVFNVASGEGIAVRDLILEVARQLGREDLVRWGARPRPDDDPSRLVADVSRLRQALGARPRRSVAAGVAEVLRAEGFGQ